MAHLKSTSLSIISTSFKSTEFLNLNYQLSEATGFLNFPIQPDEWIVVKNNPSDIINTTRFKVIDGEPCPIDTNCNVSKYSHHHALALNKGIKYLSPNTRFVLFLDPDFFVIRNHTDIMNHMINNDLSFFGAPYVDDGRWRPVANFPVGFCMYVDRTKVDVSKFNFLPIPQPDITKWYDTGHQIYEEYVNHPSHKWETVKYSRDYSRFNINKIANRLPDLMVWQEKMFAVHCHAKLHLSNDKFTHNKTLDQVKNILGF